MSDKDPQEDAVDEMAERLIRLGFATRYFVNETTGAMSISWTDSGRAFRDNMRLILNSPTRLEDFNEREIGTMFSIMLLSVSL